MPTVQQCELVYMALPDASGTDKNRLQNKLWRFVSFLYAKKNLVPVENSSKATLVVVPLDFAEQYSALLNQWQKMFGTPIFVIDITRHPMAGYYKNGVF